MTTADFIVEAVAVTVAQAVTVFCVVATVAIIGTAFWRGRRFDGVWPEERSDR